MSLRPRFGAGRTLVLAAGLIPGLCIAEGCSLGVHNSAPAAGAIIEGASSGAQSLGHGRAVVLRQQQELYSWESVTISLNGSTIGSLANGTYLSTDVPAGSNSLTATVLLSRAVTNFDMPAGGRAYIVVEMNSGNVLSPDGALAGATLEPAPEAAGGQSLLSIHFLDESSATAALAGLQPAQ